MAIDLHRLEKNLEADLSLARRTARMRFGIVAALVVIALIQLPDAHVDEDADFIATARAVLIAFAPLFGIAVVGAAVVVALMRRDIKKAHALFEEKRGFRIRPKAKK
jgi:hypothetical protein